MHIGAIVISIVLVLIDQFTKTMAYEKLRPIGRMELIDGVFSLTYVENSGVAFGLFQGARWIFVVLTSVILIFIVYYYIKLPKTKVNSWVRLSLVLIFAGAIGNFIDRFVKGYVIDFLHFSLIDFPVFNVADIYVVVGTIFLGILLLFFVKEEGGNTKIIKPENNVEL